MGKHALMPAAALLLLSAIPLRAQTPAPPNGVARVNASEAPNHVAGYTAWDDDFFYIAVQVNKPTLSGKNVMPFSNPLEDDAIILTIQTDDDRALTKPNAHTVLVAASAVGGAQLYYGANRTPLFSGLPDIQKKLDDIANNKSLNKQEQEKARAAVLGRIVKFVVAPKGAARAGGSHVPGYTLEIAIPWFDLGGKPVAEARMGFNVVAQSIAAGSPPLQSLSSRVKSAADIDNPSLWNEVQFHSAGLPARPGLFFSPRLFANKPIIDADVQAGEWNTQSGFGFGAEAGPADSEASMQRTLDARLRPAFTPQPARPAVPLRVRETAHAALADHKPQPLAHLVMARYAYRYQGDPRKAAPLASVTRPNGNTALAHHPLEGVGPWFSYDRADWHRGQLRELRRAGIDVILPEYRGDTRARKLYADKGLRVLADTLQYLQQTGQDYPQVALYLDTTSLNEALGAQPDLKTPEAQAVLYGMIRDFYRQIPACFRSQVTLNGAGGRIAYPIFLSSAAPWKDLDNTFVNYVRGQFAQDFGGADLLVLGGSDFKPKAALDGYFTETQDKGFQFDANGWIKTGSIGAGYDGSLDETSPGETAPAALFLPRHNGDTYRQNWKAALKQNPDWVLLDGWNDYDVGAEIAPTFETGYSTADITREFTRQFVGLNKRNVKFMGHDAPAAMLAGRSYAVTARLQNTGIEAWTPGAANLTGGLSVALAYRWLHGGTIVAQGNTTVALSDIVLAGQNINAEMNVAATNAGSPLSPGAYTLEVRLLEVDKKKAASETPVGSGPGTTLQIPVTITDGANGGPLPAHAATVLRNGVPNFMETGGVYAATATLRNDGAQTWHKPRVTFRLTRQTASVMPGGSPVESLVAIPDATMEMTGDVAPGQTVTAHVSIPLVDAAGKPLPVWTQDDTWTYMARWEVAEDRADGAAAGTHTLPMPVSVVDLDFGARFVSDSTPLSLPAERRLPIRMSIQNNGPQIWKKDQVRIGYHWYYQDGTEFIWEDETTPITQDVPPGSVVSDMLVWVTSPPYDGAYSLVWDVKVGDTWTSTLAATHPLDEVTHTIQVRNGRLIFADLTKAFNMDGISDDDHPNDGDFDGQGHTLPASLLPPYATGAIAPNGMWLPSEKSGPDSSHRISFRWGDKDLKSKNFIACKGQRLELGKSGGHCSVLHILAAGTGKDITTSLKLIFQEPTSQSEDLYTLTVGRWDQPPKHGEEVAFLARRYHTPTGIQNSAVGLFHYAIKIKEPRSLVALQLPNAPDIKIAAITLEK